MSEMNCALGRIDPLALAWAAGFFDGEGSTLVSRRADRPGYLRLDVTVPQCGHDGLPEVLLRFQATVAGMGSIYGPDGHDMYFWRANGFQEAHATVALLWSRLRPVKRAQAAAAMRALRRQYDIGSYTARAPRKHRLVHSRHDEPRSQVLAAHALDEAWAAGFLDAEGHFGLPHMVRRKNGPPWLRLRVSASQHGDPGVPAQVLLDLRQILGGRIERHGDVDDFRWVVERASDVEQVFARARCWLGTVKQEQAMAAIDIFTGQTRLHGTSSRCVRGHEYDHLYMSSSGPKRRCNACARILDRMERARRGIRPRQFTNAMRRYTF